MATNFDLYDRLLGGQLPSMLRAWQKENVSLAEMAYRLRSEHDVAVSHETVRRWLRRIDEGSAA